MGDLKQWIHETTVVNSLARYLNSHLMLHISPFESLFWVTRSSLSWINLIFVVNLPHFPDAVMAHAWSSSGMPHAWKIRVWFCAWQEMEGGSKRKWSYLFPIWLKQLAKNALVGRILRMWNQKSILKLLLKFQISASYVSKCKTVSQRN